MKTELLHTYVGALVACAGIIVIAYSYLSDGRETVDDGYVLTARFKAIDGISEGADVLLAGIKIGQVTKQWFESDSNSAMINMQIDTQYEIPYDSAAMILSDGIFGSKYVKVSPGGEYDMLANGDEFEFVQDSIIFEELLEKIVVSSESKRVAKKAAHQNNQTPNTLETESN